MSKYLELVEGSFNESHFNKQKNQNPYVAYSIEEDRVIYTKIPNYLCLEPIDSNNQLAVIKTTAWCNTQYSFDKETWNEFPVDGSNPLNPVFITVDRPIYLKGNNPNGCLNMDTMEGSKIVGVGQYNVSGDITTLLNEEGNVKDLTECYTGCFAYLFGELNLDSLGVSVPAIDVVNASKLILPATELAERCYYCMFQNCTSLTAAPKLPATTLAASCYSYMFRDCTSLTTAPELPATTLTTNCYNSMFQGCYSLTTAPELPATDLAESCYAGMFNGCTSITTVPELPATELASSCYQWMFSGCKSLTTTPELPATELADNCYSSMFSSCTSLTQSPELPATTLANYCYSGMFYNCTSLITAPELPATTLANYCYQEMFFGCTSLNYIKCLATDISAINCTSMWVYNVSPTGTFVKHPDMNNWTTGINGIPSDWTVEDAAI